MASELSCTVRVMVGGRSFGVTTLELAPHGRICAWRALFAATTSAIRWTLTLQGTGFAKAGCQLFSSADLRLAVIAAVRVGIGLHRAWH